MGASRSMKWCAVFLCAVALSPTPAFSLSSFQKAEALDDHAWLTNASAYILETCRITLPTPARTVLYTPNGDKPYYVGQWMRDSYYGFSNAWESVPNRTEALESAKFVLRGQNQTSGIMPQLVNGAGVPIYAQNGAALALDSGPFGALMVTFFVTGEGRNTPGGGSAFFEEFGDAAFRGLLATPLQNDLPWGDPALPPVGYGFTDSVVKTGNDLYSSVLLFWSASELAHAFELAGNTTAAKTLSEMRDRIAARLGPDSPLWDASVGMFVGATGVENNVTDVWGSALAAWVGVATPAQASAIGRFLVDNSRDDTIFQAGQVREMPKPELWTKLYPGSPTPDTYQDGGYWATPNDFTLPLVGRYDRELACSLLAACVKDFKANGAWEWIRYNTTTGDSLGSGAPSYVASIADTLAASKRLHCWTD